jgi:ABC-type methionine transport system ATPase subunit
MPRIIKKNSSSRRTEPTSPEQRRMWLMYPPKLIREPLIWKLGQKFPVMTNIRQASVTDEIGIVCLEVDGKRADVKAAIKWLEQLGVSVEPVEINVIES